MSGATEDERHASWAELFFDLVVVAGVGMLARVLHTVVSPASLGLFAVLFLALWLSWTSFMVYGNAAGEATLIRRLLTGMFGIAVMAAAIPGIAESALAGESSPTMTVFTVAYILTRMSGAGAWRRGVVLIDWPVAQQITGVIPWVVSIWVHEPWKFALWGLGILIDLVLIAIVSSDDMLGNANERLSRIREKYPERTEQFGDIVTASLHLGHLGERLGLFIIIVLGEGVIQGVDAATEAHWDGHLLVAGLSTFLLLAGMWALSVMYGYAGVPHLRPGAIPLRFGMVLHCGITASIAAVAASLGSIVLHGTEPMESAHRWLLCGAIAVYFGLGLLASFVSSGFHLGRTLVWASTGIAIPLALGFTGLTGVAIASYLALVVFAHLLAERRLWQEPAT